MNQEAPIVLGNGRRGWDTRKAQIGSFFEGVS